MASRSRQKKRKSGLKSKTAQKSGNPVFVSLVVLIPIVVYLLSFSSIVYDKVFIESEMESAGLFFKSKEINSYVVDYLMDKDETELIFLDMFEENEKQHLLDVKKVVHRTFDVLFLLLVLLAYLAFSNKKDWNRILLYSGIAVVAIPLIIYFIPFEMFFAGFHNVFFEQGTWMFPASSALIQLYPINFWESVILNFFLRGFITGWIMTALGLFLMKKS